MRFPFHLHDFSKHCLSLVEIYGDPLLSASLWFHPAPGLHAIPLDLPFHPQSSSTSPQCPAWGLQIIGSWEIFKMVMSNHTTVKCYIAFLIEFGRLYFYPVWPPYWSNIFAYDDKNQSWNVIKPWSLPTHPKWHLGLKLKPKKGKYVSPASDSNTQKIKMDTKCPCIVHWNLPMKMC